ncbi:MAG: hypothetical protein ABIK31_03310 [candidate division WOR-3 bacterium]
MILDYYARVFGSRVNVIRETLIKLQSGLDLICENLPEVLFITNKVTDDVYKIDLINDSSVTYEEYVILSSLFHQYNINNLSNNSPMFDIVIVHGGGHKLSFNEYITKYSGVFKFVKSILFLDFFNPVGFLTSSFDLFPSTPLFSEIPSFDSKNRLVQMKSDLNHKLTYLRHEYDFLANRYENFASDIEKLRSVILEIEFKLKELDGKGELNLNNSHIHYKGIDYYTERVSRIVSLISKIESIVSALKVESVRIVSENMVDLESIDKKIILDRRINKYGMWKDSLKNLCENYQNEIHNLTMKSYDVMSENNNTEELHQKYFELKNSLMVAESQRYGVMNKIKELKEEINSTQLILLDVENQLSANFKPVDVDKLITENFIKLDKEITLSERIQRFLSSFFVSLESKTYLNLLERREFLHKICPALKMRSLALDGTVPDNGQFLIVKMS